MLLIYYDEVKYDPPTQTSFWLGGIGVDEKDAQAVEQQMNELSKSVFGSPYLDKGTEFHGIEICQGKGSFKGVDFEERCDVLAELLKICASDPVRRLYVEIRPENFVATSDEPDEIAFMFFIEQANKLLSAEDRLGMLFGDYDEPTIGPSVVSLSRFKNTGTYWARSETIDRLVDTVHFAKSHHSRLIQLADVFLYCRQFYSASAFDAEAANWRKAICKIINDSGTLVSHRAKSWPVERRWYRS